MNSDSDDGWNLSLIGFSNPLELSSGVLGGLNLLLRGLSLSKMKFSGNLSSSADLSLVVLDLDAVSLQDAS